MAGAKVLGPPGLGLVRGIGEAAADPADVAIPALEDDDAVHTEPVLAIDVDRGAEQEVSGPVGRRANVVPDPEDDGVLEVEGNGCGVVSVPEGGRRWTELGDALDDMARDRDR